MQNMMVILERQFIKAVGSDTFWHYFQNLTMEQTKRLTKKLHFENIVVQVDPKGRKSQHVKQTQEKYVLSDKNDLEYTKLKLILQAKDTRWNEFMDVIQIRAV